jgi:hypothetical protein
LMVRYICAADVLFFTNALLLNHHPFGKDEVGCDAMII